MGSRAGTGFDRRALLGASLASFTAACVGCPPLPPPATGATAKLGDAHAHLFNAADLPIAGFLQYVVIPEYLPHVPEVALALVDAAVTVLKAMAPTASAEERTHIRDASPQDFANRLADRIEQQARALVPAPRSFRPTEEVGHSYAALAILLRASQPGGRLRSLSDATTVDRTYLARIAVIGRAAARPEVGVREALGQAPSGLSPGVAARSSNDLGAVWDTIKWCYEMILPRCRHVRDYLATLSAPGHVTDVVVNLLVDYDAWLGDGPSAGSSMHDQLQFWNGYSQAVSSRAEIRTFAGYDPLRHAEERIVGKGHSPYWDRLSSWVDATAGRPLASGFKIYPPMGFRVFGNTGDEPAKDRSGAMVAARWKRNRWSAFGAELDAALDQFFDLCARKRVPVVAHGRHSQEASSDTGRFASPRFWCERAQWVFKSGAPPLRASIAHWTETPEFEDWVPRILEMNLKGQADIFFDVAYTPEFLGGDAHGFMQKLADIYAPVEKSGRWLMFGSDWIMLGREAGVQRYAENAVAAIRSVTWWRDREQLVLHDNLRRFLTRPT